MKPLAIALLVLIITGCQYKPVREELNFHQITPVPKYKTVSNPIVSSNNDTNTVADSLACLH